MRGVLIAAILLAVASTAHATPAKRGFVYARWLRDDRIEIVPPREGTAGKIWVAKDAVDDATFCTVDSNFYCFQSNYYALAIPKKFDPIQDTWEHEGVTYKIIRAGVAVSIFGRVIRDLVLIHVPSSATPGMRSNREDGYFLYSQSHGVVGFGFWKENGEGERSYWLEAEKGFAASE